MRACSLGSGSSGNALVVEARDGTTVTRVLVDDGFNLKQLGRRLERAGLCLHDIDAVLVTHEHSDHVGGVVRYACKAGIPVYCSEGTALAAGLLVRGVEWRELVSGVRQEIGALVVDPYEVPHDAAEPLQFVFGDGGRWLGLLTDAGEPTALMVAALRRVDALVLECNHDEAMLRTGPYATFLKMRIAGGRGHLSNAQAAAVLRRMDCTRLRWVAAAHLSAQNNTKALACAALAAALGCGASDVDVADQEEGLDWRVV
ncbi:MAG TPA: MBL fold metallo-hydrolase [Burkholderiaceae bacterium]|nr:MBL fold metallo-hydrolase [Burkholderiaceae bacterium]